MNTLLRVWPACGLGLLLACGRPAAPDTPTAPSAQIPMAKASAVELGVADPKAAALADSVMVAMGGQAAWNQTRLLTWNFFGVRRLWWDKATGDVRVVSLRDDFEAVFNLNAPGGSVRANGQLVTQPDTLAAQLERARASWINDSYWLVMPFKLRDEGVRLAYLGPDTTQAGQAADVLALRFDSVGLTPQNRYHVWVGRDDRLVRQWAYYADSSQAEPNFVMPWDDYQTYGDLLLSGNRGPRQLTQIAVLNAVPDTLFRQLVD